jgi:hypothetical protein
MSLGAFTGNVLTDQFADNFRGAFPGGKRHRQEVVLGNAVKAFTVSGTVR